MAIRSVTIRSLGELIEALTPREPDPATGRHRDTGVYHGSIAVDQPLLTSLDRLGGTDPPHTKAHLEAHVLRNFIRYSRPFLSAEPASAWELLVIAQHHGVPTRLLDWSYSPLVAAHFAVRNRTPLQDRVVWRLDWHQVHRAFGLPGLALLVEDLQNLADGASPFTPWQLFDGSVRPLACMIEPPSLDARIMAQAAVFTLCSDPRRPFDAFLEQHGLTPALTKFIVPTDALGKVRDQLELAGVDERRLFPDLDGVAAALRRYYA
jgi:hypothetical protein